MAVTTKWFGKALLAAFNKEVDWNSDTIKIALVTSSYTFDQDAHDYFNDITNEVSGTGYIAGGQTLTSCTATYDGPSNTLTLDAADPSWATSTITARGAVVYVSTGTSSTSPLLAFIDFGADVISSGAAFTITLAGTGLLTITAA
jgi:hypothetical protein